MGLAGRLLQQWDRRRVEQENKSDYQKIVRISDAQNCKSVLISPAWRTARTGVHPQILVKRHLFKISSRQTLSAALSAVSFGHRFPEFFRRMPEFMTERPAEYKREIDLIWHPILECRMNQPGVVKIHIMLNKYAQNGGHYRLVIFTSRFI